MKRSTFMLATVAAMASLGASGIAVPTRSRPLSDRERFEQSTSDAMRRSQKRAAAESKAVKYASEGPRGYGRAAERRRRQMQAGILNQSNRGIA